MICVYCSTLKFTLKMIYYNEKSLDEKNCEICGQGGEEDKILLCDNCDSEFHMFCLRPKLIEVPEGEWLCPLCCPVGTTCYLENYIQSTKLKILKTKTSSCHNNLINNENYSEICLIPSGYNYIGCLMRLYCSIDMCYHSGRIIAQRLQNENREGKQLEHLVQFQK